jgi:hypothetical protein
MVSIILVVVGENCRNKDLSCDHHNSIGLKSGEYGDKHKIEAATTTIIGLIEASLCAGKLSITTTAGDHNCGAKHFSINTSNALPSIELSIVMSATTRRETNCTNYCKFFSCIKIFKRIGSSSSLEA